MNQKQIFEQLEQKLLGRKQQPSSFEVKLWQKITRETAIAALTGILAESGLELSYDEVALKSLRYARALVKIMKEEEEHN
jgi:uncharacterized protein YbcI